MDGKKKQVEVLRRIDELREQRKAKEKARIDKLRQMNLQKYKIEDDRQAQHVNRVSTAPSRPKQVPSVTNQRKSLIPRPVDQKSPLTKEVKIKTENDVLKKEATKTTEVKPKDKHELEKNGLKKMYDHRKTILGNASTKETPLVVSKFKLPVTKPIETKIQIRKSIAPKPVTNVTAKKIIPPKPLPRASIKPIPKVITEKPKEIKIKCAGTPKLSVFERLYNSRSTTVPARRETIFEQKNRLVRSHTNISIPIDFIKENVNKMRRSISAVHFKRIGKNELKNCFHRYSVGDGLNKLDIDKIEDGTEPQIINTIRSDRKKVKFHIGTPKPDELERRLKNWLEKRGKSVNSYQHLRCFGVNVPSAAEIDDENKENIEVNISDDGSFEELMTGEDAKMTWRNASLNDSEIFSECVDSEKSPNSIMTPVPKSKVDEVLLSALTDLSQLVREGYDWEQCARWLRAIRDKCPHAPSLAAYWECRAALEEFRGNLPRSWLCWEEAISKGTEASVAEASIDVLLDKFMQLNISPKAGLRPSPTPKQLMSAKSVFKSSLIRFAVQNAKAKTDTAKYTVTPVRRSSRITSVTPKAGRTPLLQLASSLKMIDDDIRDKAVFIPNKLLQFSP